MLSLLLQQNASLLCIYFILNSPLFFFFDFFFSELPKQFLILRKICLTSCESNHSKQKRPFSWTTNMEVVILGQYFQMIVQVMGKSKIQALLLPL